MNRTEIITLTAILKSANMFKDVHSSAPVEQEMPASFSQGDDFFQRLQTAFTGTVEDHENITKDKTRYLTSYRKVSFLTSLEITI